MAPKSLSHRSGRPCEGAGPLRWLRPDVAPRRPGHASGPPTPRAALDWPRTLQAKGPGPLHRQHLRWRPAPAGPARLHLLLLDTSGSMQRHGRLALAKGCAAWLIAQAARRGDDLGLLGFGGQGVQWLLPPGPARRAAGRRVQPLGGGGGTPLAAALAQADAALRRARRGCSSTDTWLWLLTDGRSPAQPPAPRWARQVVIVDHDDPLCRAGRCGTWAAHWGAQHVQPLAASWQDGPGPALAAFVTDASHPCSSPP